MKSAGASFWGVVPSAERASFQLAKHVHDGEFLPDEPQRGVVLGKKLARSLQASVGAEIVVLVQAADGSLGNELFTVTGILSTVGDAIDRSAALMHEHDFRELFVFQDKVHEIALNSMNSRTPEEVVALIRPAAAGAELKTWREIMPTLSDMANVSRAAIWIFLGIFFLAAGLGVLNTMLMATYERFHEFGVLKAMGATPWRIVSDVLLEALTLGVLATVIGAILGLAGGHYLETTGIDTRSLANDITFFGVAFDPILRASMSPGAFVWPVVVMWAVCVAASIYPAVMVARLDPVKAIQHV
jgi:ABC-type lipoprotein release transport system permease subunit